jgi:arylsulfatase A
MKNLHTGAFAWPMISRSCVTCRRREWNQNVLRMLFINLLLLSSLTCWASATQAAPPNVVMILADDQSYQDFGFMGNDLVHTPNLDELARSSTRYPNGYVPMSVCRPSLATLLTGLYPHQHGIHFNHPPPGLNAMRKLTGEQYRQTRATTDVMITRYPTLPRILASHGYACLQTGKHWEGDYRTAGFTDGMTLAKPSSRLSPITGTRKQAGGDWVAHGNGDVGLTIGRETMKPIEEFVARHAGKRPFMVWYAPFLPHTPFDAPQRFHDLYAAKRISEHLRPYYAEIARFDQTVGDLLAILRKHDAIDNTLIVFASDNGFRPDSRRHDRQNSRSKLSPFEDGIRTPILLRWPGKTKPADHPQLVGTTDLVPTILAAVGVADEITPDMKGINLLPSARGEQDLPDRPAFGAIYPNDATELNSPALHVRGRWIRWGNYKLILSGEGKARLPSGLFDLRSDPNETSNLIDDRNQQQRVEELTRMLDQWWKLESDK